MKKVERKYNEDNKKTFFWLTGMMKTERSKKQEDEDDDAIHLTLRVNLLSAFFFGFPFNEGSCLILAAMPESACPFDVEMLPNWSASLSCKGGRFSIAKNYSAV